MPPDFTNILKMEFIPLSQAKAKLSEFLRMAQTSSKRIAITTNGRPTGILLSFADFQELLKMSPSLQGKEPIRKLDFVEWKKNRKRRLQVRDSIFGLFDMDKLSHKGQKAYKRETVRDFSRKTKKRA